VSEGYRGGPSLSKTSSNSAPFSPSLPGPMKESTEAHLASACPRTDRGRLPLRLGARGFAVVCVSRYLDYFCRLSARYVLRLRFCQFFRFAVFLVHVGLCVRFLVGPECWSVGFCFATRVSVPFGVHEWAFAGKGSIPLRVGVMN